MNKIKQFLYAKGILTNAPYKKINSIDELLQLPFESIPNYKRVHHVDLSGLDLSKEKDMFTGPLPKYYVSPEDAKQLKIVTDWTTDVIWPAADKLPHDFNPIQELESAKIPTDTINLHKSGKTGKDISIAIIDQRLNCEHPEYASNIKHYSVLGPWDKNEIDYHGSLVSGCAVGHTTGTAPDANLYYFAAPMIVDGELDRKYINEAIRQLLEINKTLPENKKIRFLSCSWGGIKDKGADESKALFDECEKNGIMVIGGAYKEMSTYVPYDKRYKNKTNCIGIPTNGKTTPFWQGGYYYTRQGGQSSTFPYIAGILACATQGNALFFTRQNWPDELRNIIKQTATNSPEHGLAINPDGIAETVTQITKEMEKQVIINKSNQHE